MNKNLKFDLGRKSIGFLLLLFLFSGPVGGEELNKTQKNALFDLLRPVVKTVMLAVETDPVEAEPSTPAARAEQMHMTRSPKEADEDSDLYRICWGDTCWSIARRHGMSLSELTALNPGLDPEKIKSGDYLLVRRMAVATSRGRSGPRSLPLALTHPLPGARLTSRYGIRRGRMHWELIWPLRQGHRCTRSLPEL